MVNDYWYNFKSNNNSITASENNIKCIILMILRAHAKFSPLILWDLKTFIIIVWSSEYM